MFEFRNLSHLGVGEESTPQKTTTVWYLFLVLEHIWLPCVQGLMFWGSTSRSPPPPPQLLLMLCACCRAGRGREAWSLWECTLKMGRFAGYHTAPPLPFSAFLIPASHQQEIGFRLGQLWERWISTLELILNNLKLVDFYSWKEHAHWVSSFLRWGMPGPRRQGISCGCTAWCSNSRKPFYWFEALSDPALETYIWLAPPSCFG